MVTTAATSAFLPIKTLSSDLGSKNNLGGSTPSNLDTSGIKSKVSCSGRLQVKANAQAPGKINGSSVGLLTDGRGNQLITSPRTFINQLPDWSMLLAAITTMFLTAEKQWMMLDNWKPRHPDMLIDPFGLGRIVQDGFVFCQNFSIRSYEIGADKMASMETLMNHLQQLTNVKTAGLLGDGFGSTPEMCKKNLMWVLARMQPRWSDLDVNQHVNNVKYIGWALESVPLSLMESHELSGIILKYRRECGRTASYSPSPLSRVLTLAGCRPLDMWSASTCSGSRMGLRF